MNVHPTKLELASEGCLVIEWSDGLRREYAFVELAEACPCATCRGKREAKREASSNSLNVLSASEARPMQLVQMTPIGNYAYKIVFQGGCDMGIYTFELLRELGQPQQ